MSFMGEIDEQILFVLFFLFGSFILSMMESALIAVQENFLYTKSNTKLKKHKETLTSILSNKNEVLSLILLLNTFCNIFASSTFGLVVMRKLSNSGLTESIAIAVSTIVSTAVIYIMCESLPKVIGIAKTHSILYRFGFTMNLLRKIFFPITKIILFINNFIIHIFDIQSKESVSPVDDLIGTTEMYHEKGTFSKKDKDLLNKLLKMKETAVGSVMTHRNNMTAINLEDSEEEILEMIYQSHHSRIPVYEEKPDNIKGVLIVKDFLKLLQDKSVKKNFHNLIKDTMQTAIFSPESMNIKTQFENFQKQKKHMSFVLDEYGGLMGIITLEDIFEQIFGEIEDETDAIELFTFSQIGENHYLMPGDYSIKEFEEITKYDLSWSRADTVAGLIMEHIERIPDKGERLSIQNENIHCEFVVKEVVQNKILNIEVKCFELNSEQ